MAACLDVKTREPIVHEDVSDSEEFIYQVKWDGVCIQAAISKERCT